MTHSDIAHNWAHKKYGRKGSLGNKSSNIFTNGDTIYSYGSHFPMAHHISENDPVYHKYDVYMTTRGYSVSTSKHLGYVLDAISHLKVLRVYTIPTREEIGDLTSDHQRERLKQIMLDNIKHSIVDALNNAKLSIKARQRKGEYLNNMTNLLINAQELKDLYKITIKSLKHKKISNNDVSVWKTWQSLLGKNWQDDLTKAKSTQQRRAAIQKKKQQKEAREKIALWKAGEIESLPFYCNQAFDTCFLRVVENRVETSKNIRITCNDAWKLWRVVKAIISGKITKLPEIKMANVYRVDRIDIVKRQLVIGCHTISFYEMGTIAGQVENVVKSKTV